MIPVLDVGWVWGVGFPGIKVLVFRVLGFEQVKGFVWGLRFRVGGLGFRNS